MARERKQDAGRPISQKALAEYLNLSPSTVSLVMNNAPRAQLIPEPTRQRIRDAAAKFDYRPDFYAKYLYSKRSLTVAVILPEIREAHAAMILAGIDLKLTRERYLYFTANHHGDEKLIREYPRRLLERAVEGFISINTTLATDPGRPWVVIGSQPRVPGVPRFAVNNRKGGEMAMRHLAELGHRRIAIIKGHPWRLAAGERWQGIQECAKEFGIKLDVRLVQELHSGNTPREASAPEEGYFCAAQLIKKKVPFTALITFNDVTAIGAIRAFREAGLRTPEDISVIGFDDIESTGYLTPTLTTLRQPLQQMGELAADHLLTLIEGRESAVHEALIDPTLIQRESTRPLV
ncbi:MAG TPA: LacI family DNA-binding transcriptional regulator [Acidobacteriaceae bacterium]